MKLVLPFNNASRIFNIYYRSVFNVETLLGFANKRSVNHLLRHLHAV